MFHTRFVAGFFAMCANFVARRDELLKFLNARKIVEWIVLVEFSTLTQYTGLPKKPPLNLNHIGSTRRDEKLPIFKIFNKLRLMKFSIFCNIFHHE